MKQELCATRHCEVRVTKTGEGTGKEEADTMVCLTSLYCGLGSCVPPPPQNHHYKLEAGNGPADSSLLLMRVYRHLGYVAYPTSFPQYQRSPKQL